MKMTQSVRIPLCSIAALIAIAMALPACTSTDKHESTSSAVPPPDAAAKMVDVGSEHMNKFLSYEQTEALKNMLGGARGVFIAPNITGGAALFGVEEGTGFLMRRHGKDWSDPAFFKLTQYSLGYQAGGKEAHVLILLMTDTAVDSFIKGKMVIGGKGGFAIGTMGMGASGAGGIKGGLELIVVSTNEGLFLGGGMSTMSPVPATPINDTIYGKNADLSAILAATGGKFPPAANVRSRLSAMVLEAWDNPPATRP